MNGVLQKIFVGLPIVTGEKDAREPMEREWKSAIFKEEVSDAVYVGFTNLDGDGQADLKHHGGPEKAVFAYSTRHYPYWNEVLDGLTLQPGAMGENLSLTNLHEGNVCIGDTYQLGETLLQVSQPRQPCWKPARRFKQKNLALLIQKSGRTGWYFRVLQTGYINKGDEFRLIERPFPQWSINKCNEIMHIDKENKERAFALASCELLAVNWRQTLSLRAEKGEQSDVSKRVFGPNE